MWIGCVQLILRYGVRGVPQIIGNFQQVLTKRLDAKQFGIVDLFV